MQTWYSISKLAKDAGVPSSTVRYYDRIGLLRPAGRTEANYRRYNKASFDRLLFIRAAKAHGFTLADIRELLKLEDNPPESSQVVHDLIKLRLAQIQSKLNELMQAEKMLQAASRTCNKAHKHKNCPFLNQLRKGAVVSEAGT